MSPRRWNDRIRDILVAIKNIEQFVSGHTLDSFASDTKTYHAILLNIQIIGEASSHISDEIKTKYPQVPWRAMKAFRNHLAHVYFDIDTQTAWEAIHEEIIPLKSCFEKILNDNE